MMLKIAVKITKLALSAATALLLIFCILFAVLQSKWAKIQIEQRIVAALESRGITASVEEVSGQLPFTWKIKEVDLCFSGGSELILSHLELKVALFPLLRGRVALHSLKVEEAEYAFFPKLDFVPKSIPIQNKDHFEGQTTLPSLPIGIRHFTVSQLRLVNKEDGSTFSMALRGSSKVHKKKEEFSLELLCFSPDENKTYLEASVQGNKKKNFVSAKLDLHLEKIPSFLGAGFDAKWSSQCDISGPWTSVHEIFQGLPVTQGALAGKIHAKAIDTRVEKFPLFDRDWSLQSSFALTTDEIALSSLRMSSNLIHLKAKGSFHRHMEKTSAFLAFSTPDLSLFSPVLPFQVQGSAKGKIEWTKGDFKASLQTQDLTLEHVALRSVQGTINGSWKNSQWQGDVLFSSADAALPFEFSLGLEYTPNVQLGLKNFQIKASDATLQGNLNYDWQTTLCQGSLFADIDNLESWTSLVPKERIAGRLNAELALNCEEGEQNALFVLVTKNIRFNEILLDDFTLRAKVEDLKGALKGKLNLLAERVYTPGFYLDRLTLETKSDEVHWPFYLDVEGRIENPFTCYSKGFWQYDSSLFSLELTHLFGKLANTHFSLQFPCEFEWGAHDLALSPIDVKIGEGSLFSTFELSPLRSLGQWELRHFPLEVLSCLRPRFALNGFISSNGYIDASPDRMEAAASVILEEAGILHLGKKQPLQAKGSLQANLSKEAMQMHAALRANDGQFLDLSASLPVDYATYPFYIGLNPTKNTSAELVAEGKLQDLFDFVNLGTSHFTGLLSCRLFLSQSLLSPLLKGSIEWQNGTYENDFTGINLRKIDARFEAQGEEIRLIDLKASDEKSGTLSGEGKLLLNLKEKLPFSLQAEMKDLHAVGFDMIDCNLTGPLYLTGSLEKMQAQGNFLVDAAKIQITESLPYEVPSMPVTFVNTPLHVAPVAAQPEGKFAFHMDLELTSEGTVKVVGRGLNAELEGNVHLYGINTNIAANGALKLIKGEYLFSGKIFKLTEGEVVFLDKPTSNAYLHLNGILNLPDISITVMLRGPLMAPQLTFQSNPQKPTSSILALILFNKDITEISHPEAIQLASTLVSLSGGAGPDVLETIRRNIGVDRLNIASKPGSDELAVQIGKYLTKGVLITLSQSATSSQVIVEVELPHGFLFQAETQEEEEGKFSLKWRKTY
jgi:autotransporter translocation and assembly factor TamB